MWISSYPEIVCKADLQQGLLKNALPTKNLFSSDSIKNVFDPGELFHDSQATKDKLAAASQVPETPSVATPATPTDPESLKAKSDVFSDQKQRKSVGSTIYAGDTGGYKGKASAFGKGPGGGL